MTQTTCGRPPSATPSTPAHGATPAPPRYQFAPSPRLADAFKQLTGNSIQNVFITDSDLRHIRDHHSDGEARRGQVDVSPEDIALLPFVLNEFDNVVREPSDKLGNEQFTFTKQINGTAYAFTVERGTSKEQVKTLYFSKKRRVPNASPTGVDALGLTFVTTPTPDTLARADALRNSKKNLKLVTDENGEPQLWWRGESEKRFSPDRITLQGTPKNQLGRDWVLAR